MQPKSVDLKGDFARNNFDLLRIFAASQVVIFHTMTAMGIEMPIWLFPLSVFPGVPIFFFVSGYLVSASFERSSSLQRYARNRALRIFPGLWVCLAVAIVIASLFGVSFFRPSALTWGIAQMAALHFTPAFMSDYGIGSYNGSLWTIPVELQFYVVLPIVYFLGRATRHLTGFVAMAFVIMLGVAAATLLLFPGMGGANETIIAKLLRYSFVPHVYLFLFGILVQRLSLSTAPWLRGMGLYWVLGYLALQVALQATGLRGTIAAVLFSNLLLGIVVLAVSYTAVGTAERVLRGNDISYGVYIYHALFINVLVELGWLRGNGLAVLFVGACTLICATASWKLVEQPVLAWGKRRAGARLSQPVVVAQ